MLILAIDTSTRNGSVALLRDDQILASVSGSPEIPYSSGLFSDLELVHSKAPFGMNQIDVFAVCCGPGSFTGLRVGLTAVKAWAEVYRKPIAAVSGLEAIAAQSRAVESNPGVIAAYFDARRGQVFGALYRSPPGNPTQLELIVEESTLSPEEFLDLVKAHSIGTAPVLVSPTPNILPAALLTSVLPGAQLETVSGILAPVIGHLGFDRANRGLLVDAMHLDANYVRRSDAESAWKDG